MAQKPKLRGIAAGRGIFQLDRRVDPTVIALHKWNSHLVVAGTRPAGPKKPTNDKLAYKVLGAEHRYSRPRLRVRTRQDWDIGPAVRFDFRDEELWLQVGFEEDFDNRVEGTLPFDVSVKTVTLDFIGPASGLADLHFTEILQEPLAVPLDGPAFRIEASAAVPASDAPSIVTALQEAGQARWMVSLIFDWKTPSTPLPRPHRPTIPTGPVIVAKPRPVLRPVLVGQIATPARVNRPRGARAPSIIQQDPMLAQRLTTDRVVPRDAVFLHAAAMNQVVDVPTVNANVAVVSPLVQERLQQQLSSQLVTSILQMQRIDFSQFPGGITETIPVDRVLTAHYPDILQNRAIYAAISGEYASAGWQDSADGQFRPTHLVNTVYCLPDAYRIAHDPTTAEPAILPLLTVSPDADNPDNPHTEDLRIRLTFRIAPDFDNARLSRLRNIIRGASNQSVLWADLVLGSFQNPRFIADQSLEGLGDLVAGVVAVDQDFIDARGGFTLTYEGTVEFISLLSDRLTGPGIGGHIEMDLVENSGESNRASIPVILTLAQLVPIEPQWTILPQIAINNDQPDSDVAAETALDPVRLKLHNQSSKAVSISRIKATALLSSPTTGKVGAFTDASPAVGPAPLILAPNETRLFDLATASDFIANRWDVSFEGVGLTETADAPSVLRNLFDGATANIRGWRIDLDCPPMEFFDSLPESQKTQFSDVVAIEVELRRAGHEAIVEARLTRSKPRNSVQLSRSLNDFLDSGAQSNLFEFRRRLIRVSGLDEWTEWQDERGGALSVFFT